MAQNPDDTEPSDMHSSVISLNCLGDKYFGILAKDTKSLVY